MIDIELQKKLRAEYNPDGSLLRRQQMRMLEILLHIDKICKENNIPYWLSSGTLLGAVRHEGFIPWDDDVDIEMMREDYLRFEKTKDYMVTICVCQRLRKFILPKWSSSRKIEQKMMLYANR